MSIIRQLSYNQTHNVGMSFKLRTKIDRKTSGTPFKITRPQQILTRSYFRIHHKSKPSKQTIKKVYKYVHRLVLQIIDVNNTCIPTAYM